MSKQTFVGSHAHPVTNCALPAPFGKHICCGCAVRGATCPLPAMRRQTGVTDCH